MSEHPENMETEAKQVTNLPTCDVSIDIGQILAANQALLKNMARRMEQLENKLSGMEKAFGEHSRQLVNDRQTILLLSAPAREVKPWEPPVEEKLNSGYFSRFSLYDRLFRPWKMRRHSN